MAAFPDWHPAHFLDTAEMTHACAIGYDWFYHYWTSSRRTTIRSAIINLGLNAGLAQYTSNVGWSQSSGNNWSLERYNPWPGVMEMVRTGEICDGETVAALMYAALALGRL